MTRLRSLIKEVLSTPPKKKDCNCGCGGCSKKAISLNEGIEIITLSEGLQYHINNKTPLTEQLYRAGSKKYFELWAEARSLYSKNLLNVKGDDEEILNETHLGYFGMYEGKKVPLDFPIYSSDWKEQIDEAKKKKKKNPPLNKPKRGGSKAYYVYVRDPKTKKIKKVSFGSGGLKAKINNPKARQAFAKRHNCKNKKDKTKAGYWSCRLPRYAKQLGLKSTFTGFW